MDMWDFDADNKQKAYDNQLEKREAAKVEMARLQEWKRMSATPGPRGLADLQQAGFDGRLEDADLKINIQKQEIKKWDAMAKNWKKYYGDQLSTTDFSLQSDGVLGTKRTQMYMQDKPRVKVSPFVTPLNPTALDELVGAGTDAFDKLLGRDTLKHEGFRKSAYPDSGGKSIGYGSVSYTHLTLPTTPYE